MIDLTVDYIYTSLRPAGGLSFCVGPHTGKHGFECVLLNLETIKRAPMRMEGALQSGARAARDIVMRTGCRADDTSPAIRFQTWRACRTFFLRRARHDEIIRSFPIS
jgi:hypothetical protein